MNVEVLRQQKAYNRAADLTLGEVMFTKRTAVTVSAYLETEIKSNQFWNLFHCTGDHGYPPSKTHIMPKHRTICLDDFVKHFNLVRFKSTYGVGDATIKEVLNLLFMYGYPVIKKSTPHV